eukprot:TRINITY_DN2622_c0_g1_i1.p1 TRINITY_DN2622_c0_g1~~TRINITY_DN2622_c0_g1_i1.p1  ORF type:complete len:549 (-),score=155.84 TRINITY_DN2622_c0_g1_i1:141-1787(-)
MGDNSSSSSLAASLIAICESTRSNLVQIWTAIGLSTDEQQQQLEVFAQQIQALHNEKLQQETKVKQDLEDSIVALKAKIADLYKRLSQSQPAFDEKELQGSLRDQEKALLCRQNQVALLKDEAEGRIKEHLTILNDLWSGMGISIESGFDAVGYDLSEAKLLSVKQKISTAQEEITTRKQSVAAKVKEITELLEEVGLATTDYTSIDQKCADKNPEALGVHASIMEELESRRQTLLSVKQSRQDTIRAMAVDINALWNRLKVPQSERDAFLGSHSRLSPDTVSACEAELKKLQAMKHENLRDLILTARERLASLWTELHFGEEEKKKCACAFGELYTDDVLEAVEQEAKRVETRLEMMRPILALIAEREQLKKDHLTFVQSSQDPNRFKIPGRLLQEEKFRKMYEKKMPKIEEELRAKIPQWEESNGPLLVEGKNYMEQMKTENEEFKIANKAKKPKENAKQVQATPKAAKEAKNKALKTSATPNLKRKGKLEATPRNGTAKKLKVPQSAFVSSVSSSASALSTSSSSSSSSSSSADARPPLVPLSYD